MDAGVSTSLVHYHFETRDALLEQALEYSLRARGRRAARPRGRRPRPGQRRAPGGDDRPVPSLSRACSSATGSCGSSCGCGPCATRRCARRPRASTRGCASGSRRRSPPASSAASFAPARTPTGWPTGSSRWRTATECASCSGPGRGRRAPRDLGRDRSRARPPERRLPMRRRAGLVATVARARAAARSPRRGGAAAHRRDLQRLVRRRPGGVRPDRQRRSRRPARTWSGIQEPEGNLRRIADVAGMSLHRRDAPPDLALPDLRGRARRRAVRLRGGRAGPRRGDRQRAPPRHARTGRRWSGTASPRRRC